MRRTITLAAAAAFLSFSTAPLSAQGGAAAGNSVDTRYATAGHRDDDGFPWGLLGLLGLAGLIPRVRRSDAATTDSGTTRS
jgi:MYXO-CTERM domain-containing protein